MMMKFILSVFLLLGSLVGGQEVSDLAEPLFVSLGGCCEVAVQLRNHGFRKEAYPFDWLLTLNHEKFLQILDEDFQFFLDENCIFQHPEHPTVLENGRYACEFRHDAPANVENGLACHLQEIAPKYARRIARFRKLKDFPGRVIFIRSAYDFQDGGPHYWWNENQEHITAFQAQTLKMALDRYFPLLNFTLVIINHADVKMEKISGIKGVIEFKVKRNSKWIDYAKLLHSFSL